MSAREGRKEGSAVEGAAIVAAAATAIVAAAAAATVAAAFGKEKEGMRVRESR